MRRSQAQGGHDMNDRRDFFRSAARTGLALGLAAAGRPLIALPEPGKASAAGDDVVLLNTALALEHEAIWAYGLAGKSGLLSAKAKEVGLLFQGSHEIHRSEEHTSELQSRENLVCRLL